MTVLGWLVFNYLQGCVLQEMGVPTGLDFALAIGSFFLAYIVLWQRVVRGSQLAVHASNRLKVAMWLWRIGVAVLQIFCLGVALLLLEFRLIDSSPQDLDMLP
jgi:threonine/homoserine efflux transporter RhtA